MRQKIKNRKKILQNTQFLFGEIVKNKNECETCEQRCAHSTGNVLNGKVVVDLMEKIIKGAQFFFSQVGGGAHAVDSPADLCYRMVKLFDTASVF